MESIIDDQGRWWNPSSRQFRRFVFLGELSSNQLTALVNNLGFIRVLTKPTILAISLNPNFCTRLGLLSLYRHLFESQSRAFVVRVSGNGDVIERLCRSAEIAHRVIENACFDAKIGFKNRFISQSLPRERLSSRFGNYLSAWSHEGFETAIETMIAAQRQIGSTRYSIWSHRAVTGDFRLEHFGQGQPIPNARAIKRLSMTWAHHFPDANYGAWLASTFRQVVISKAPTFELVSATVNWEPKQAVKHNYQRLLLPCRVGKEVALFGATDDADGSNVSCAS